MTVIKFIILAILSFNVLAADQLTWDKPELREDDTKIETIEKYMLYHWYENILQPVIEISGADIIYSDPNQRIGIHVYEISTVEAGQEGEKSDPFAYYKKPNSKPAKIMLTIELIE